MFYNNVACDLKLLLYIYKYGIKETALKVKRLLLWKMQPGFYFEKASRFQTYFEKHPCHGISPARPGKHLCHDLVGEQTLK